MFSFLKKKGVESEDTNFDRDFRECLVHLESILHREESTETIILDTLKCACEFYAAEWCGIITTDTEAKMWSASIWYDAEDGEMAQTLFDENEYFENYPRWVEALETQEPVIISDVAELEDLNEAEALHYKKLEVTSVMGASFGNRPLGFLIVKNPNRYKTRPDLLKMLAFVSMSTLYLAEVIESINKHYDESDDEEDISEDGIRINLFGAPELKTRLGSVDSVSYNSKQGWMVLTYMAFRKNPTPSRSIATTILPDKDIKAATESIRGIIYRMRKKALVPSDIRIFKTTDSGYELNSDVVISCDVWDFDSLYEKALATDNLKNKIEYLEKAVALYKGTIYRDCSDQEWLMVIANFYEMRYIDILSRLFEAYDKTEQYDKINILAVESLMIIPHNVTAYYWMYKTAVERGNRVIVANQIDKLENILTEEELKDLKEKLGLTTE